MKHLLISTCCLFSLAFSQSPTQELRKFCQQIIEDYDAGGFALALIHKDSVIFLEGFGFADQDKRVSFTPQTIQRVGSVSQLILGMSLTKALEEGYLRLDDPINNYLPFKVYHYHYPEDLITFRHLATHTSGILDRYKEYRKSYLDHGSPMPTLEHVVQAYTNIRGKSFKKRHFIKHKPGSAYTFSHFGSSLAAYALECAVGENFPGFSSRVLLKPLEMDQSHWFSDSLPQEKQAILYYKQTLLNQDYQLAIYPSSGFRTSCEDLSKFLISILSNKDSVLEPSSSFLMLEPQYNREQLPEYLPKGILNMGIFWDHFRWGRMGHFAIDKGLICLVFLNPETGEGRILMTNNSSKKSRRAVWQIMGAMEMAYSSLYSGE